VSVMVRRYSHGGLERLGSRTEGPQVHHVTRKRNAGRWTQKYALYRALKLCLTPLSSILDKVAHTIPLHVMKLCEAYRVCHSASKHHIKDICRGLGGVWAVIFDLSGWSGCLELVYLTDLMDSQRGVLSIRS
jgi:hypothetical protein